MSEPGIVFYAETAALDVEAFADRWLARLEPATQQRCQALRFARDRRDFLAAHVLLELMRTADTKRWSLTHTHGLAAVVLSSDESVLVGVDAEPISAVARLETMRAVLLGSDDELEIGLVELWTVKEAYLKATGEGFATERGFGVLPLLECALVGRVDDWDMIAIRDARTGVRVRGWSRRVGGHVVSVVPGGVDGEAPRLERVALP